jgi:glutamate decarboxylase
MSLAQRIGGLDEFDLITKGDQLPVFAFTTSSKVTGVGCFRRVAAAAGTWLAGADVPFPEHREDLAVLRPVCRNGFSLDLADLLFENLLSAVKDLDADSGATVISGPSGSGTDRCAPGERDLAGRPRTVGFAS